MQVYFGTVAADNRKIDKRADFAATQSGAVAVQITDSCNLHNPTFIMGVYYATHYNYMYVPKWDAYYFLGEPTVINGDMVEVPAIKDVLTSNADEIKALTVHVVRYEEQRDKMLQDAALKKTCRTQVYNDWFSNNPFTFGGSGGDMHFLLSVVGGNGSRINGGDS